MATTALIRRAALHQTEIGAQLSPSNPVLQQNPAQSLPTSATRFGPPARASRLLRPDLWIDGAAIGADGVCGCLPLTALLAFFAPLLRGSSRSRRRTLSLPPGCIERKLAKPIGKDSRFNFSPSERSELPTLVPQAFYLQLVL